MPGVRLDENVDLEQDELFTLADRFNESTTAALCDPRLDELLTLTERFDWMTGGACRCGVGELFTLLERFDGLLRPGR